MKHPVLFHLTQKFEYSEISEFIKYFFKVHCPFPQRAGNREAKGVQKNIDKQFGGRENKSELI